MAISSDLSTLSVSSTQLLADNVALVTLTATILDTGGLPVAGASVVFSAEEFVPADTFTHTGVGVSITNGAGVATATFKTGQLGNRTFVVTVDGTLLVGPSTLLECVDAPYVRMHYTRTDPFTTVQADEKTTTTTLAGREIVVKADPNNSGAITEITWNGISVVNSLSKARGVQPKFVGEDDRISGLITMNEAGALSQAWGDPSSAPFIGEKTNIREYLSQSFVAYEAPVTVNGTPLQASGNILSKQVFMDFMGNPHILGLNTQLDMYSTTRGGYLNWALSVAANHFFTKVYAYAPDGGTATPAEVLASESIGQVFLTALGGPILAYADDSVAIGIFRGPKQVGNSLNFVVNKATSLGGGPLKFTSTYTHLLDYEQASTGTGSAAGVHNAQRYLCIGTLADVVDAFDQLRQFYITRRNVGTSGAGGGGTTLVPTALVIQSAPASAQIGSIFQVAVAVVDQFGDIMPNYAGTAAITDVAARTALTGTKTVPFQSGIALFNDLSMVQAGQRTLRVTAGTLSVDFLITALHPIPTLVSISPTTAGDSTSGSLTLTANGTGFINGQSRVTLNGANLATTYVSTAQLTALIPENLLNVGNYAVRVVTNSPGGGVSNSLNFQVTDTTAPVITGFSASASGFDINFQFTVNELCPSVQVFVSSSTFQDTVAFSNINGTFASSITSLDPGTYQVQIRASDAASPPNVSLSNILNVSISKNDTTPPTVTSNIVTSITQTSALVRWTTDTTDEPSTGEVRYRLANTADPLITVVSPLGAAYIHAAPLTGLTPDTLYEYVIVARDPSLNPVVTPRNTFQTLALADTTPPVITSGPTSSSVTQTQALISWTTNEDATSTVQYGVQSGVYSSSTTLPGPRRTVHSVPLSGLSAGTIYFYRVVSADAALNSTASAEFTFTTQNETQVGDLAPGESLGSIEYVHPEGWSAGQVVYFHFPTPLVRASDLNLNWRIGTVVVQRTPIAWNPDNSVKAVECIVPITLPAGSTPGTTQVAEMFATNQSSPANFTPAALAGLDATLKGPDVGVHPDHFAGLLTAPLSTITHRAGPWCSTIGYYKRFNDGTKNTLGVWTFVTRYLNWDFIPVECLFHNAHINPTNAPGTGFSHPFEVVGKIYFDELIISSAPAGMNIIPRHLSFCMNQAAPNQLKLITYASSATETVNPGYGLPVGLTDRAVQGVQSEMWPSGMVRIEHMILQPLAPTFSANAVRQIADYQNVARHIIGRNSTGVNTWFGAAGFRSGKLSPTYVGSGPAVTAALGVNPARSVIGDHGYDLMRMEGQARAIKSLLTTNTFPAGQGAEAGLDFSKWVNAPFSGCWTPGHIADPSEDSIFGEHLFDMQPLGGHTRAWSYFYDLFVQRQWIASFGPTGLPVSIKDYVTAAAPLFNRFPTQDKVSAGIQPLVGYVPDKSVHAQVYTYNVATCAYDSQSVALGAPPPPVYTGQGKVFQSYGITGGQIIVIEAESTPIAEGWVFGNTEVGETPYPGGNNPFPQGSFRGTGYYYWPADNRFTQAEAGISPLRYDFNITVPGEYRIQVRSKSLPAGQTLSGEHNDAWVRVDGSGTWQKFLSNYGPYWINRWRWASSVETGPETSAPLTVNFTAGHHYIEISPRSNGWRMDRFHIYQTTIANSNGDFTNPPVYSPAFDINLAESPYVYVDNSPFDAYDPVPAGKYARAARCTFGLTNTVNNPLYKMMFWQEAEWFAHSLSRVIGSQSGPNKPGASGPASVVGPPFGTLASLNNTFYTTASNKGINPGFGISWDADRAMCFTHMANFYTFANPATTYQTGGTIRNEFKSFFDAYETTLQRTMPGGLQSTSPTNSRILDNKELTVFRNGDFLDNGRADIGALTYRYAGLAPTTAILPGGGTKLREQAEAAFGEIQRVAEIMFIKPDTSTASSGVIGLSLPAQGPLGDNYTRVEGTPGTDFINGDQVVILNPDGTPSSTVFTLNTSAEHPPQRRGRDSFFYDDAESALHQLSWFSIAMGVYNGVDNVKRNNLLTYVRDFTKSRFEKADYYFVADTAQGQSGGYPLAGVTARKSGSNPIDSRTATRLNDTRALPPTSDVVVTYNTNSRVQDVHAWYTSVAGLRANAILTEATPSTSDQYLREARRIGVNPSASTFDAKLTSLATASVSLEKSPLFLPWAAEVAFLQATNNVPDVVVKFAQTQVAIPENIAGNNSQPTVANFSVVFHSTVGQPVPTTEAVRLQVTIAGVSGLPPYLSVQSDPIVINPGQTSGTFQVTTVPTAQFEGDRSVILQLAVISGPATVLSGSTLTVTILEDEQQVPIIEFLTTSFQAIEGSIAEVRVRALNQFSIPVAVPVQLTTTASPSDFSVLPWPGGTANQVVLQSSTDVPAIRISITSDSVADAGETITLRLLQSGNAYVLGSNVEVTITIGELATGIPSKLFVKGLATLPTVSALGAGYVGPQLVQFMVPFKDGVQAPPQIRVTQPSGDSVTCDMFPMAKNGANRNTLYHAVALVANPTRQESFPDSNGTGGYILPFGVELGSGTSNPTSLLGQTINNLKPELITLEIKLANISTPYHCRPFDSATTNKSLMTPITVLKNGTYLKESESVCRFVNFAAQSPLTGPKVERVLVVKSHLVQRGDLPVASIDFLIENSALKGSDNPYAPNSEADGNVVYEYIKLHYSERGQESTPITSGGNAHVINSFVPSASQAVVAGSGYGTMGEGYQVYIVRPHSTYARHEIWDMPLLTSQANPDPTIQMHEMLPGDYFGKRYAVYRPSAITGLAEYQVHPDPTTHVSTLVKDIVEKADWGWVDGGLGYFSGGWGEYGMHMPLYSRVSNASAPSPIQVNFAQLRARGYAWGNTDVDEYKNRPIENTFTYNRLMWTSLDSGGVAVIEPPTAVNPTFISDGAWKSSLTNQNFPPVVPDGTRPVIRGNINQLTIPGDGEPYQNVVNGSISSLENTKVFTQNDGNNTRVIRMWFEVTVAGTYEIRVRTKRESAGNQNLWISFDGEPANGTGPNVEWGILTPTGALGAWGWSSTIQYPLSAAPVPVFTKTLSAGLHYIDLCPRESTGLDEPQVGQPQKGAFVSRINVALTGNGNAINENLPVGDRRRKGAKTFGWMRPMRINWIGAASEDLISMVGLPFPGPGMWLRGMINADITASRNRLAQFNVETLHPLMDEDIAFDTVEEMLLAMRAAGILSGTGSQNTIGLTALGTGKIMPVQFSAGLNRNLYITPWMMPRQYTTEAGGGNAVHPSLALAKIGLDGTLPWNRVEIGKEVWYMGLNSDNSRTYLLSDLPRGVAYPYEKSDFATWTCHLGTHVTRDNTHIRGMSFAIGDWLAIKYGQINACTRMMGQRLRLPFTVSGSNGPSDGAHPYIRSGSSMYRPYGNINFLRYFNTAPFQGGTATLPKWGGIRSAIGSPFSINSQGALNNNGYADLNTPRGLVNPASVLALHTGFASDYFRNAVKIGNTSHPDSFGGHWLGLFGHIISETGLWNVSDSSNGSPSEYEQHYHPTLNNSLGSAVCDMNNRYYNFPGGSFNRLVDLTDMSNPVIVGLNSPLENIRVGHASPAYHLQYAVTTMLGIARQFYTRAGDYRNNGSDEIYDMIRRSTAYPDTWMQAVRASNSIELMPPGFQACYATSFTPSGHVGYEQTDANGNQIFTNRATVRNNVPDINSIRSRGYVEYTLPGTSIVTNNYFVWRGKAKATPFQTNVQDWEDKIDSPKYHFAGVVAFTIEAAAYLNQSVVTNALDMVKCTMPRIGLQNSNSGTQGMLTMLPASQSPLSVSTSQLYERVCEAWIRGIYNQDNSTENSAGHLTLLIGAMQFYGLGISVGQVTSGLTIENGGYDENGNVQVTARLSGTSSLDPVDVPINISGSAISSVDYSLDEWSGGVPGIITIPPTESEATVKLSFLKSTSTAAPTDSVDFSVDPSFTAFPITVGAVSVPVEGFTQTSTELFRKGLMGGTVPAVTGYLGQQLVQLVVPIDPPQESTLQFSIDGISAETYPIAKNAQGLVTNSLVVAPIPRAGRVMSVPGTIVSGLGPMILTRRQATDPTPLVSILSVGSDDITLEIKLANVTTPYQCRPFDSSVTNLSKLQDPVTNYTGLYSRQVEGLARFVDPTDPDPLNTRGKAALIVKAAITERCDIQAAALDILVENSALDGSQDPLRVQEATDGPVYFEYIKVFRSTSLGGVPLETLYKFTELQVRESTGGAPVGTSLDTDARGWWLVKDPTLIPARGVNPQDGMLPGDYFGRRLCIYRDTLDEQLAKDIAARHDFAWADGSMGYHKGGWAEYGGQFPEFKSLGGAFDWNNVITHGDAVEAAARAYLASSTIPATPHLTFGWAKPLGSRFFNDLSEDHTDIIGMTTPSWGEMTSNLIYADLMAERHRCAQFNLDTLRPLQDTDVAIDRQLPFGFSCVLSNKAILMPWMTVVGNTDVDEVFRLSTPSSDEAFAPHPWSTPEAPRTCFYLETSAGSSLFNWQEHTVDEANYGPFTATAALKYYTYCRPAIYMTNDWLCKKYVETEVSMRAMSIGHLPVKEAIPGNARTTEGCDTFNLSWLNMTAGNGTQARRGTWSDRNGQTAAVTGKVFGCLNTFAAAASIGPDWYRADIEAGELEEPEVITSPTQASDVDTAVIAEIQVYDTLGRQAALFLNHVVTSTGVAWSTDRPGPAYLAHGSVDISTRTGSLPGGPNNSSVNTSGQWWSYAPTTDLPVVSVAVAALGRNLVKESSSLLSETGAIAALPKTWTRGAQTFVQTATPGGGDGAWFDSESFPVLIGKRGTKNIAIDKANAEIGRTFWHFSTLNGTGRKAGLYTGTCGNLPKATRNVSDLLAGAKMNLGIAGQTDAQLYTTLRDDWLSVVGAGAPPDYKNNHFFLMGYMRSRGLHM